MKVEPKKRRSTSHCWGLAITWLSQHIFFPPQTYSSQLLMTPKFLQNKFWDGYMEPITSMHVSLSFSKERLCTLICPNEFPSPSWLLFPPKGEFGHENSLKNSSRHERNKNHQEQRMKLHINKTRIMLITSSWFSYNYKENIIPSTKEQDTTTTRTWKPS